MLEYLNHIRRPDEEVELSMKLCGTDEKAAPEDVKLQIRWANASQDFYGLQGQVNINNIQGRKYPYAYFVVVAKRGLNIFPAAYGLDQTGLTTVETKMQNDVEVIVIRQYTTKTSGYHTKPVRIRQLLDQALVAARRAAEGHPRT